MDWQKLLVVLEDGFHVLDTVGFHVFFIGGRGKENPMNFKRRKEQQLSSPWDNWEIYRDTTDVL